MLKVFLDLFIEIAVLAGFGEFGNSGQLEPVTESYFFQVEFVFQRVFGWQEFEDAGPDMVVAKIFAAVKR